MGKKVFYQASDSPRLMSEWELRKKDKTGLKKVKLTKQQYDDIECIGRCISCCYDSLDDMPAKRMNDRCVTKDMARLGLVW